jgi:hypothetical protein
MISMLEAEAIPHSCIPFGFSIALYMRVLLLVESSDLRPSSQCILVIVIPSCFRSVNLLRVPDGWMTPR